MTCRTPMQRACRRSLRPSKVVQVGKSASLFGVAHVCLGPMPWPAPRFGVASVRKRTQAQAFSWRTRALRARDSSASPTMAVMVIGLVVAWLSLCLAPQGGANADPEQTAAGRSHYLGREIAQTMHWTGAAWLLRETREAEENGARLLRWLDAQPGQVVCDLGCGNGYHTLPLADAVRPDGKVFAVDVQPQMLKLLLQRAEPRQREGIVCIEGAVDDPKLPPGSCDLVLMVDVYHELSHPVRVMQRVRAALRPGGRVVLVEFRAEDPEVPIKPEHTMSKAQIVRELAAHGFALAAQTDALPWQHAMAFVSVEAPPPRHEVTQLTRACLEAWAAGDRRGLAPFAAAGVTWPTRALGPDARAELSGVADGKLLATIAPATRDLAPVRLLWGRDGEGRWLVEAIDPPAAPRPLYAMHTGCGPAPAVEQAALARELGFAGLASDGRDLAAARAACERAGGDLISVYVVLEVADGASGLEPALAAVRALAGGPGMVWLALQQRGVALRAAAGDAAAQAVLAELLREADRVGVEVALYPHHGFWLETTADALRLCEALDHPRLGVCFNVCHFLRCSPECDPAPTLAACGARLLAVTVCGAQCDGEDWGTLIQPLDVGDFDLRALLAALDARDVRCPIALQGFGLRAPPREHLARSLAAWCAAGGVRR